MNDFGMKPFFISIPHAGEEFPENAFWLKGLSEPVLMRDVDRYVDALYAPTIAKLGVSSIITKWHRYVIDLNRLPTDIDAATVEGCETKAGTHARGLHWAITTWGEKLMTAPMTQKMHDEYVELYYEPFHKAVREQFAKFKAGGATRVFHLDCHSMPSKGTSQHKDPGAERADIVVSDQLGTSAMTEYKDLVIQSYEAAGFTVAYNHPYIGGGITVTYGKPAIGQHTIQVEMNRKLYMNEETKKRFENQTFASVQNRLDKAVTAIYQGLDKLLS